MQRRKMILILLFGGFVLVMGVFYFALRNTKTTVTHQLPYSEYINKELVLQRAALLVKNVDAFTYYEPYLLVEENAQVYSEITETYKIPAGTKLRLSKAVLLKNGVSGFTTSIVVGTIYVEKFQKEIAFEYIWGTEHVSLTSGAKSSWTYPLALWQKEETREIYSF